jgi:hypothetical protein
VVPYEHNVFVNCPFDEDYVPLLRPLLFTILYLRLEPRIALERSNSGEVRLTKIVELIRQSKYSIHDLSRSVAAKAGESYRLNMPFELGVDYGCRAFGQPEHKAKVALILEAESNASKVAISDLAGLDVQCHHGDPSRMIAIVRNWLKSVCLETAPGPATIRDAFMDFMALDYEALTREGFSPADIDALPIGEQMQRMTRWLAHTRSSQRS